VTESLDRVRVPIAPPVIFAGYLIGALLLNWVLPLPLPWVGLMRALGGLMTVSGLFLGASAIKLMSMAHTSPDLRSPTTALVTEGLYAHSRNPIYLTFRDLSGIRADGRHALGNPAQSASSANR
jgi:protein-S-isoprenylcysteine O-methyltransferase Ste14